MTDRRAPSDDHGRRVDGQERARRQAVVKTERLLPDAAESSAGTATRAEFDLPEILAESAHPRDRCNQCKPGVSVTQDASPK